MASSASAVARLNDVIARVRALGEATPEFARDGAEALREELTGNIAAARGPDGKPWAVTQAGGRALKNAAKALRVVAEGTRIVATLSGPEANQSIGKTRGAVARPILPTRKLSAPAAAALERVFTKRFRTIMGSGG